MLRIIWLLLKRNKFRTFLMFLSFFIINFVILVGYLFYVNLINFYTNFYGFKNDNLKFEILPKANGIFSLFGKDDNDDFYHIVNKLTHLNLSGYKLYRRLTIPSTLKVNLFGNNLVTDIFIFAIQKNLNSQLCNSGSSIFYISSKFLSLYNSQISDNKFFPKLTLDILKHIKVKVIIGKSSLFSFGSLNKILVLTGYIGSFDEDLPLIGLGVDYNILKKYNLTGYLVPVKFIGYARDLQQFFQIKKIVGDKVMLVTYDTIKLKVNQNTLIVKYGLIFITIVVVLVLFIFLIYILYSSFYLEKDIWNTYFIETLSYKYLGMLIFGMIFFVYIFAFVMVLGIVSILYLFFSKFLLNNLTYFGINLQLTFYSIKFLMFIFFVNFILIFSLSFLSSKNFKV